jgi:hypothetical protein
MPTETEAAPKPHVKLNRSIAEEAVEPAVPTVSLRDKFIKKKKRVEERQLFMDGEETTIKVQALTQKQLDDLYAQHPKRRNKEVDNSLGANSENFPPSLFATAILDPKLDEEEWHTIWTSPEWSPGELGHLLDIVMNVTSRGFDPPFGARG